MNLKHRLTELSWVFVKMFFEGISTPYNWTALHQEVTET